MPFHSNLLISNCQTQWQLTYTLVGKMKGHSDSMTSRTLSMQFKVPCQVHSHSGSAQASKLMHTLGLCGQLGRVKRDQGGRRKNFEFTGQMSSSLESSFSICGGTQGCSLVGIADITHRVTVQWNSRYNAHTRYVLTQLHINHDSTHM